MTVLDESLEIQQLFDCYGVTLSDRKRDVIDLYYNEDLSLSEIAENIHISRQGVSELLCKAKEELFTIESQMHLLEKKRQAAAALSSAESLLDGPMNDGVREQLLSVLTVIRTLLQ